MYYYKWYIFKLIILNKKKIKKFEKKFEKKN